MKMYFLLKMVIFQPAMLVYQRVSFASSPHQGCQSPPRIMTCLGSGIPTFICHDCILGGGKIQYIMLDNVEPLSFPLYSSNKVIMQTLPHSYTLYFGDRHIDYTVCLRHKSWLLYWAHTGETRRSIRRPLGR